MPQHYLRQFAVKGASDNIWMYDKKDGQFKLLPIKNVAQASKFYFEEDESALSEHVEAPALQPLEHGFSMDRGSPRMNVLTVAQYLQSQLCRVPKMRSESGDRLKRNLPNMMRQIEDKASASR